MINKCFRQKNSYLFAKRLVSINAADAYATASKEFKDVDNLVDKDDKNWGDALNALGTMRQSALNSLTASKKIAAAEVESKKPGDPPDKPVEPPASASKEDKEKYKTDLDTYNTKTKPEYDRKKADYEKAKAAMESEFQAAEQRINALHDGAKARVNAARQARMDAEKKVRESIADIDAFSDGTSAEGKTKATMAFTLLQSALNNKDGALNFNKFSTTEGGPIPHSDKELQALTAGILAANYDAADNGKKAEEFLAGLKTRGVEDGNGSVDAAALLAESTKNFKKDRSPAGKEAKSLAKEILDARSADMPPQLRGILLGELSKSTPENRAMIVARIKMIKNNYTALKGNLKWNDEVYDSARMTKAMSVYSQLEDAALIGEFSVQVEARYNRFKEITGNSLPEVEKGITDCKDDPTKIRASESQLINAIQTEEGKYKDAKATEINDAAKKWKVVYDYFKVASPIAVPDDWDKADLPDFQEKYKVFKAQIDKVGTDAGLIAAANKMKDEVNGNIKKIKDYKALYDRAAQAGADLTGFSDVTSIPADIPAGDPDGIQAALAKITVGLDKLALGAQTCEGRMKALNDALRAAQAKKAAAAGGGAGGTGGATARTGGGGGRVGGGGGAPREGGEVAGGVKVEAGNPYDRNLIDQFQLDAVAELKNNAIPSWARSKEADIVKAANAKDREIAQQHPNVTYNNVVTVQNTDGSKILVQVRRDGTISGYYPAKKAS